MMRNTTKEIIIFCLLVALCACGGSTPTAQSGAKGGGEEVADATDTPPDQAGDTGTADNPPAGTDNTGSAGDETGSPSGPPAGPPPGPPPEPPPPGPPPPPPPPPIPGGMNFCNSSSFTATSDVFSAEPTTGTTYYVRSKGGTASQCTGLTNADYLGGTGTKQPCAFSHPFIVFPPGGKPILKGGDTLIIASGSYRMGYGAPNATNTASCDTSYPWDCYMPAIPSGPDAQHPTRILGEGYNGGCKNPPQLYGVERVERIINLRGSDNIYLNCLEITDHSKCVLSHNSSGFACKNNTHSYGEWAPVGIHAEDSENVTFRNVSVHGLADRGIWAYRLKDWKLENVNISGNGWVGWDGDSKTSSSSSNTGMIKFRCANISWNGCGETYPDNKPQGCWAQTAGGYGDGLGTEATAGNWIFENSTISHNTSDGLDLLYHQLGGTITIDRLRAEGNAGNQVKITGNSTITNSVIIGNCAFFNGKSFTYNVDNCRALGTALLIAYVPGASSKIVNSTIYSEGDCVINAERRTSCNGTEKILARNNIFYGGTDYHQPYENSVMFYQENCGTLNFNDAEKNIVYNTKPPAQPDYNPPAATNFFADPKIDFGADPNFLNMKPSSGSPAIDKGIGVGTYTTFTIPSIDFLGNARPLGSGVDLGAYEVN